MPLHEQDSPFKYRDTCTACVGKVFKIITESTLHSPTSEAVEHMGWTGSVEAAKVNISMRKKMTV